MTSSAPSTAVPAATPAPARPMALARIVDRASAQAVFAALERQARSAGVTLRPPPPEPTTCCGRGCNGCVWEGFMTAAETWRDDALQQLG